MCSSVCHWKEGPLADVAVSTWVCCLTRWRRYLQVIRWGQVVLVDPLVPLGRGWWGRGNIKKRHKVSIRTESPVLPVVSKPTHVQHIPGICRKPALIYRGCYWKKRPSVKLNLFFSEAIKKYCLCPKASETLWLALHAIYINPLEFLIGIQKFSPSLSLFLSLTL